jgi:hypothetical protein
MKIFPTLIAAILPATFVLADPISAKAREICADDLLRTHQFGSTRRLKAGSPRHRCVQRMAAMRTLCRKTCPITKMST